jgi:class 3 adenylate cyclase
VTLVVDSDGMRAGAGSVVGGAVRVRIRNQTGREAGVFGFGRTVARLMGCLRETPATWGPFLTASSLLSLQRFRDVYRVQELPAALRLRIRSLTLLFTDLSGSTALYEATGDVTAFDIVREHFELLGACVRAHEGAVVKTMGDAIMASFPRPEQALEAARAMVEAMEPVTRRAAQLGHRVGLKVGVHEGPALVVNADDRLDYFGQTVNVAARVQGLAGPGEVWVTKALFDGAGGVLASGGYRAETQRVPLKGVEGLVEVVRCARAG